MVASGPVGFLGIRILQDRPISHRKLELTTEQPNKYVAFLVQDRHLVLGFLFLLFVLTVIFAGMTARFLADLSTLYKTIPTIF